MPLLQHLSVSTAEQILIDPHYKKIIEIVARKHTKGTSIAWEDAAQTAHIKIFEAIRKNKFEGYLRKKTFELSQINQLYAWAKTVAKNAIIDMIRKEERRKFVSLDAKVPGSDVSILDTVADDGNTFENVERLNLIETAFAAIASLEERFPKRGYMKLWEGMLADKKQMHLALDLGVTQGEVSRRRKELFSRLAQELEFLNISTVKEEQKRIQSSAGLRVRSDEKW